VHGWKILSAMAMFSTGAIAGPCESIRFQATVVNMAGCILEQQERLADLEYRLQAADSRRVARPDENDPLSKTARIGTVVCLLANEMAERRQANEKRITATEMCKAAMGN
jgi:hypothetical protein